MGAPVFIGGEVAAAGFRLAGAEVRVPAPGGEAAALEAARAAASVVMIDAAVAARLPAEIVRAAVRATSPLTVVVPDLQGEFDYPELAARLRRQLGIDA